MQTVVETPASLTSAERLFTAEERAAAVDTVAADPLCGVVIPQSGGIRKVRFGFGGRGKSGGARAIYLFGGTDIPVFLLAAFAKNEKSDLSANGARKGGGRYVDEPPESKMTKRAYNKIMAGIDDARAYLDGSADKQRYRIHVPEKVDVKRIRTRLGLSQANFAATYGFAISAVRDWEQGRRRPERSARILLKIVEKEPEAITRALAR
jgi:putative transcriptional regulator